MIYIGNNLFIKSANSETNELMNGMNIVIINNPSPTRNGRLIKSMFISGTTRAKIASTTINTKKAANIGADIFNPEINIVEPACIMPVVNICIVGMLPTGKES